MQAAEAANGRVKKDNGTEPAADGTEPADENTEVSAPAVKPMNMNSIYLAAAVVALIGIGAAAFLFRKKKNTGKENIGAANERDEENYRFYDGNDDEDSGDYDDYGE